VSTTQKFRALHADGFFVIPNPWDVGSAVRLESAGFAALATTSSGFAATLGRDDWSLTFDELCAHVESLVAAVEVPISVDAERLFSETPEGVGANVEVLAQLGAAGCSIEDYDSKADIIDPIDTATARVAAAVDAARGSGLVVTARAEQHLHSDADLDDTIERLTAFRDVGADVVYAPGLVDADQIGRVVASVAPTPVNVLLRPKGPSPEALADLGVRRASTGGALARRAYATLREAADEFDQFRGEGPSVAPPANA
jgi:2-methylisocitrate lyase-like PEP mutase family enzyme